MDVQFHALVGFCSRISHMSVPPFLARVSNRFLTQTLPFEIYTFNIISQPQQWMTLCPPTFDRLRPLPAAAHTTGDVVFLLQSIDTNGTLCKQDTVRMCCRWHLVQECYAVLLQCISGQFQHHLMYGQSDITAAIQVIP
jgi:hypothetical protein